MNLHVLIKVFFINDLLEEVLRDFELIETGIEIVLRVDCSRLRHNLEVEKYSWLHTVANPLELLIVDQVNDSVEGADDHGKDTECHEDLENFVLQLKNKLMLRLFILSFSIAHFYSL